MHEVSAAEKTSRPPGGRWSAGQRRWLWPAALVVAVVLTAVDTYTLTT